MSDPVPSVTTQASATTRWALVADQQADLQTKRAAGIGTLVVRMSWKDLEPTEGNVSASYVSEKRAEFARLRAAGFKLILDSGLQDVPAWVHRYPDSFYVNQYGERWTSTTDGAEAIDKGDANLVFNARLRGLAGEYLASLFAAVGTDFSAVRVGGGHWNELGYPAASTPGHTNTYWAFDAAAQSSSPVPGWRPGAASPNGEASRFLNWYLDALVRFQTWQIDTVRSHYQGSIMVLYPSWGMRPGDASAAVDAGLHGTTSAERNGEVQRGYDVARQVAAVTDAGTSIATTWLDARAGDDRSPDQDLWRPVKYLASLAASNPLHPPLWGENTGQGDADDLSFSVRQARAVGLAGVIWCRESELGTAGRASLGDYRAAIAGSR